MKKLLLCLMLFVTVTLAGCGNVDVIDTTWKYDRAMIKLPNDECIVVKIKSWRDYENGEMVQITDEIDTVYLTSSYNVVLIKE